MWSSLKLKFKKILGSSTAVSANDGFGEGGETELEQIANIITLKKPSNQQDIQASKDRLKGNTKLSSSYSKQQMIKASVKETYITGKPLDRSNPVRREATLLSNGLPDNLRSDETSKSLDRAIQRLPVSFDSIQSRSN